MTTVERSAPEFAADARWLGIAAEPPSFAGMLRGRPVLLCFWEPHSSLCESALATLNWLELCFTTRPLAVLSVLGSRQHSSLPTYEAEAAIERRRIRHPVLVDDGAALEAFGVSRWPTFVLVDGGGVIRFLGAGTPDRERMVAAIEALCNECVAAPLPPWPAARPAPVPYDPRALGFPGGLAFDPERGRLWIADSGHHRLLSVDPDSAAVERVVGCGLPGMAEGDPEIAAFAEPRGLCFGGGALLVADRGNHSIRRVDPATGRVENWVGDGAAAHGREGLGFGIDQRLDGPCHLSRVGDELLVTCADARQVWSVGVERPRARARVGSGVMGRIDGPALEAMFQEPFGIAGHDGRVAILDRGAGALRWFDLDRGEVTTVAEVGAAGALAGACRQGEHLLVCDAVEHRVLRIDPRGGRPEVLLDADAGLRGPEALVVIGQRLFIADTGNHRIAVHDLDHGGTTTLRLVFDAEPADPPERLAVPVGADLEVALHLQRPDGARIDGDVGAHGLVEVLQGRGAAIGDGAFELDGDVATTYGVSVPVQGPAGLRVALRYATTTAGLAARHVIERQLLRGLRGDEDGARRIEL